tara:strand:+ start:294 stop:590 length:297 start_codon:yes stop_codon:yes gene_type:complete
MAEEQPVSVSSESKVAIPIQNLISILGAVAISTWAYFGVIERLNRIEGKLVQHWEEIEENDKWIDEWKPPEEVQNTIDRVRELELRLLILETKYENQK